MADQYYIKIIQRNVRIKIPLTSLSFNSLCRHCPRIRWWLWSPFRMSRNKMWCPVCTVQKQCGSYKQPRHYNHIWRLSQIFNHQITGLVWLLVVLVTSPNTHSNWNEYHCHQTQSTSTELAFGQTRIKNKHEFKHSSLLVCLLLNQT